MTARWIGVGKSAARDSLRAGAQARERAVAGRDGLKALVVFSSAGHDLHRLLQGIDPQDTPLVGCSTAGEIATQGPSDQSVVVMALGGEGFAIASAVATGVSACLREAGAEVAGQALDALAERPYQ